MTSPEYVDYFHALPPATARLADQELSNEPLQGHQRRPDRRDLRRSSTPKRLDRHRWTPSCSPTPRSPAPTGTTAGHYRLAAPPRPRHGQDAPRSTPKPLVLATGYRSTGARLPRAGPRPDPLGRHTGRFRRRSRTTRSTDAGPADLRPERRAAHPRLRHPGPRAWRPTATPCILSRAAGPRGLPDRAQRSRSRSSACPRDQRLPRRGEGVITFTDDRSIREAVTPPSLHWWVTQPTSRVLADAGIARVGRRAWRRTRRSTLSPSPRGLHRRQRRRAVGPRTNATTLRALRLAGVYDVTAGRRRDALPGRTDRAARCTASPDP